MAGEKFVLENFLNLYSNIVHMHEPNEIRYMGTTETKPILRNFIHYLTLNTKFTGCMPAFMTISRKQMAFSAPFFNMEYKHTHTWRQRQTDTHIHTLSFSLSFFFCKKRKHCVKKGARENVMVSAKFTMNDNNTDHI